MNHQPSRRPPYIYWSLDRWKIGIALLLWLALIFYAPPPLVPPDSLGAAPVVRTGHSPLVGGSVQDEPVVTPGVPGQPRPTEARQDNAPSATAAGLLTVPASQPDLRSPPNPVVTIRTEESARTVETDLPIPVDGDDLFTCAIWEPGRTPLRNSLPLFYGQAQANSLVEILVEGRQYQAQADDTGYWQFAPSLPLPVGMTWVQVRQVDADGVLLSPSLSQMVLVGADATPVSPPGILPPVSLTGEAPEETSDYFGIGPAGVKLIFYAQAEQGEDALPMGQTIVSSDGMWSWQAATPLAVGRYRLWAVAVDDAGKALSRSWPVARNSTSRTNPPVLLSTPITQ